jgi:catechol 2,3-dioxygenase
VGDIAQARAFYVDLIGFELITSLDVAAFLSAGGYHHHVAVNTWKGVGVGPAPEDAVGLAFWSATLPTEQDVTELEQRLDAAGARHERTATGALVTWDPWGIELRLSAAAA